MPDLQHLNGSESYLLIKDASDGKGLTRNYLVNCLFVPSYANSKLLKKLYFISIYNSYTTVRVLWRRKVRGRKLGRSVECQSRGSMVVWFCFCNRRYNGFYVKV